MPSLKQLKEQNRISRSALTDEGRAQLWPNMSPTEAAHTLQRWMNIVVNVSRRIANLESMDSILVTVVQLCQRLLKSDVAALVLWNEDATCLEIKYLATPREAHPVDDLPETSAMLHRVLQSSSAVRYPDDLPPQSGPWLYHDREIQTGIIAPLDMNDNVIGGLWVGSFRHQPYHLVDLMGIKSLSEQATIALEHGMMRAQLQSIAVLEERSRIAREMHDGVVQTLGSLGLGMLALETLLHQGSMDAALEEVASARENIRNAQADVRENILSLRTTLSGSEGVAAALQKYLEGYSGQTGIKTNWRDSIGAGLRLTSLAEVQLLRIIQEALTNIRKHAGAHNIWLSLVQENKNLVVTVRDDGCGFQPAACDRHFGLQTMRERAESVGGVFSVSSQPNHGTMVELRLPLLED